MREPNPHFAQSLLLPRCEVWNVETGVALRLYPTLAGVVTCIAALIARLANP
jgi:hypothetical protein